MFLRTSTHLWSDFTHMVLHSSGAVLEDDNSCDPPCQPSDNQTAEKSVSTGGLVLDWATVHVNV